MVYSLTIKTCSKQTSEIWNNPHSSVVEKLFAGRASMTDNIADDFGELLNNMDGNLKRTKNK